MRYTIAIEKEVKDLAAQGKSLGYISSSTGIPKKVIWGWCPELRPHEDVIRTSVKQRYHYNFPEYESRISAAFSSLTREDISDDEWEEANDVIHDTLFEEAVYVFKNVLNDPPAFNDSNKLSDESILDYIKKYWNNDEITKNKSTDYVRHQKGYIRYWSCFRNRLMKDMTNGDIQLLKEKLISKGFAPRTISQILLTGTLPLKYAYKHNLTMIRAFDVTMDIENAKPCITKDMAFDIFIDKNWKTKEALLANWIAFNTGMTLQEVKAIKVKDIFPNFISSEFVLNKKKELLQKKEKQLYKINEHLFILLADYVITNSIGKDDFLFCSDGRNWGNELRNICDEIGIKSDTLTFDVWTQLKSS